MNKLAPLITITLKYKTCDEYFKIQKMLSKDKTVINVEDDNLRGIITVLKHQESKVEDMYLKYQYTLN